MALRHRPREFVGLAGAIGVVIVLAGFVGGYMTVRTTIVWAFGVWIVGTMPGMVLTDAPKGPDR